MISRVKIGIGIVITLLVGYAGWNTYHYFFDNTAPSITMNGICDGGMYAGTVSCALNGYDSYKITDFSLWLDGKPLIEKFRVGGRACSHPFSIPTKNLINGKHILKVEMTNGTYAMGKTTKEITFFVDNDPLQAVFLNQESLYKVFQGRTIHMQFQVNKRIKEAKIHAFDNTFVCFPESKNSLIYECFIPITCEEAPNEYLVSAYIEDLVGNLVKLDSKIQVISFPFKKQQLKVDAERVKKEKEFGMSNTELEKEIERLVQQSPQEKLWHGIFYPPIEIQSVSTEFGTVRTTQEKGRYVHKAVDVLNAPKSVVWAPQDGIVVVKNRYDQSGNTVVLDHGFGIFSLFYHLEDFAENLNVGSKIKRGNPIGKLGMTGYASGYHLHWEMRINNIAVDPMQWINQRF
jgi:murein DD-endopeptidase MepM/ murein hydrolase activator NlpD